MRHIRLGQEITANIVSGCLDRYGGGKAFFESLDGQVCSYQIFAALMDMGVCKYENILLTGRFGSVFQEAYGRFFRLSIYLPGGLRDSSIPVDLGGREHKINSRTFALVDDSSYSYVTRDRIAAEVTRCKGKLRETFVVYDGARGCDDSVHALARYYQ